MGLESGWKALLLEKFPDALVETPQNAPNTVIIDGSIQMRSWLNNRTINGMEVVSNIMYCIKGYWSKQLESVIIMFDEKERVPKCKEIEQQKRAQSSRDSPPYRTEIEILEARLTDERVPSDLKRYMATSYLIQDFYRYVTSKISYISMDLFGSILRTDDPPVLIIDGGRIPYPKDARELPETEIPPLPERSLPLPDLRGCVVYAKGDNVRVHSTFIAGESDLKVVCLIDKYCAEKSTILIKSCDSDYICTILLHMNNWIDTESHMFRCSIYLDITPPNYPKDKPRQIIFMNQLWRDIIKYMRSLCFDVANPVETFVTIIMMSGTDYVNHLGLLTPALIWKSLDLPIRDIIINSIDPLVRVETAIPTPLDGSGIDKYTVTTEPYYGPRLHTKKILQIAEHRLFQFYMCMLYCDTFSTIPLPRLNRSSHLSQDVDINRVVTLVRGKYSANRIPRDNDIILATMRRLSWNIQYWGEHGCYDGTYNNPFAMKDGLSLGGWILDPKTGAVSLADKVYTVPSSLTPAPSSPSPVPVPTKKEIVHHYYHHHHKKHEVIDVDVVMNES